jgi:hypothetical protein
MAPRSTLFDYLDLWSYDGTLEQALGFSGDSVPPMGKSGCGRTHQ